MLNTISNQIVKISNIIYQVAIYIRLSREDDNLGESESIINQRLLLTKWVEEQGYIIADIYIDDGFSGTNFDRPAFQRMMKDLENGKANMVVTKDLSRLGRDYIGTGEYIEKYFPQKNIRYVALTDGIDTAVDSANNDMAPFRAVFNDMYAKDISKKIRTSLRTKQKEGLWVGGCAPFGYMVDPENKNHLLPDLEEDWIVKKIFSLALEGKSIYQIRTILTDENIPTRAIIKGNKNNRISHATTSKNGIWSTKTVKGILTNQLYTGDMVQNRRTKVNYKIKKVVWNDKSDWIIVENTHEPLISKENFDIIQKMMPNNSIRSTKKNLRLLDGLLYCYECNHRIGICNPRKSDGRTYIVCNYYRMNSKYNVCTSHGFNYDYLEEQILAILKAFVLKYLKKDELEKQIYKLKIEDRRTKDKYQLEKLEEKYQDIINKIDKIYIDKIDEKINEDMYNRLFNKFNCELEEVKNKISELRKKVNNDAYNFDINGKCRDLLEKFIKMQNPNRDMLLMLVDKIYIHRDKQVDIYFNFPELNII